MMMQGYTEESVTQQQEKIIPRQGRTLRDMIARAFIKGRDRRKISRVQLAKQSMIDLETISDIENAEQSVMNFNLGTLEELAAAMDYNFEWRPLPAHDCTSHLRITTLLSYAAEINHRIRITLHDPHPPVPLPNA